MLGIEDKTMTNLAAEKLIDAFEAFAEHAR
jgi:hypothetical protein